MKLLFTLLCLLSSTFSWAVYLPSSTTLIDSCEVIELTTGEKLLVQVNRVENDNIYFHLCGETDFPERKLQMKFIVSRDKSIFAINEIRRQNEEDLKKFATKGSVKYCEKLILTNQEEILVDVVRVDSLYLYFHLCDKPNLPVRKLKLGFIQRREKTNQTALSLKKKERALKEVKKRKNSEIGSSVNLGGLFGFLVGFIIPPLISIFIATGNLRPYFFMNLLLAALLAVVLPTFQTLRRLKRLVALMVLLGTLLGALIMPFIVSLFL